MFKAFKPSGMEKIARVMGYQGNMQGFQDYVSQDPMRQQQMQNYTSQAIQMAKGGVVKRYAPGGAVTTNLMNSPTMAAALGSTTGVLSNVPLAQKTTAAFGEEGNNANTATRALGENPGDQQLTFNATTQAVGEEDGDIKPLARPIATLARGEEGNMPVPVTEAVGEDKNNPIMGTPTTMMVGEEDIAEPLPGPATQAVGEDGAAQQPTTPAIGDYSIDQMYNPALPAGGVTVAATTPVDPSQNVAAGTGQLTGQVAVPTAMASTAQAGPVNQTQANTMQAAQAAPAVDAAMNATQAAQADPNDPRSQVTAAQQTASSVGNLQAAQGNAVLINNPVQRQIQSGEIITGTGVDAQAAAQLTAQTQAAAATANPSQQAMVQDQLSGLMNQFQGGATPAWAAGAMRNATAQMAARGLGASSLAGQALVQAAMESAMPIAQADAATIAKFESQNLSNRQQSAMMAAEQRARFMGQEFDQAFQVKVQNASRIADIANQNFTAEQQVQLENSRAANTMNLQNLSNTQALVMAEAAALAQLDTANLNNRQQAAVQNAQNFLQYDMANLSNRQQTDLFKAQQRVQSLFTDQAATNAAAQFNASSQNQTDQFFANLASQVSQFNATQQNAQSQFNAGQANTVNRFNAELNNQRDQFNAQNQLVIAQSNAQWRRQIATADTAAVNRANELNANAILDISKTAYDNLWTYYADTMEWAWESSDNEADRQIQLAVAKIQADSAADLQKIKGDYEASKSAGTFIMDVIGLGIKTDWSFGGLF